MKCTRQLEMHSKVPSFLNSSTVGRLSPLRCRLAKIASVRRDSYASSEENLIASENGSFMGSWTATRGLVEQQVQCLGDKVDSQADQLRTKIDEQGDKIESLYGEIKLMQGILLLLVLVLAFAAGAAYTSGQNALFGLAG